MTITSTPKGGASGSRKRARSAAAAQSPSASDAVRAEWLRRVEAEYRSATITHHFTLWLMQIGASPDLVRGGLRIVDDEMVHSEMSYLAYEAAGGSGMPAIARETLQLRRHEAEPLEMDVTRVAVNTFCLGETVAVPLFKTMRAGCTVPDARRVLDRVLRDEVRHRDFGWTMLAFLFDLPIAPVLRALVARELPVYFGRIRLAYGEREKARTQIDPADRAWGLMPPAEYAAVVERTLTRDWIPRFERAGIDARAAWDAARV